MLSEEQIERYARHILLREVGGVGQEKILAAAVRLEGLGRIGCWAASYLALAGVGSLILLDQRPVPEAGLLPLLSGSRAGQRRDLALAEEISGFNPDVDASIPAAGTAGGRRWPGGLEALGAETVWAGIGSRGGSQAVEGATGSPAGGSSPATPLSLADGPGFLAVAAGEEAILGWTERICAPCLRGALAEPQTPPDGELAALTGSLVASALLAAILDPPGQEALSRQGLHRRGISGGQVALPPCPHEEAEG